MKDYRPKVGDWLYYRSGSTVYEVYSISPSEQTANLNAVFAKTTFRYDLLDNVPWKNLRPVNKQRLLSEVSRKLKDLRKIRKIIEVKIDKDIKQDLYSLTPEW